MGFLVESGGGLLGSRAMGTLGRAPVHVSSACSDLLSSCEEHFGFLPPLQG